MSNPPQLRAGSYLGGQSTRARLLGGCKRGFGAGFLIFVVTIRLELEGKMAPKKDIEVIEIESSVSGEDAARESSSDVEVVRPRDASNARGRIAASGDLERDGLSIAGGTLVSSRSFLVLAASPSSNEYTAA